VRARIELTFWQELQAALGVWEPEAAGLGRWSLSVHHGYDPVGKTLYQGTGERRRAEALNTRVVTTVAGTRSLGLGWEATEARQHNRPWTHRSVWPSDPTAVCTSRM
jgi:hypothetical protein